MQLHGLHHVTAVTRNAQANLDFYTLVLGLRLVKRTVNQDDVSAYHLFYGDKLGSAGTELTFFDRSRMALNSNGAGSIAATALRVPSADALDWWATRLTDFGVKHNGVQEFHSHKLLRFADPEGQMLALVDDDGAPGGTPWEKSPIPEQYSIGGLYASTLLVRELAPTAWALTEVMGYQKTDDYPSSVAPGERIHVFELGEGGAGKEIWVVENAALPIGQLGTGGVHHIAFRTPDFEEQQAWRAHLTEHQLGVSGFIDRFYFRSIYFRIPGNFLFEIATDGPGFATDEDAAHLGEELALPPFLEPRRAQIEAGLKPLTLTIPQS